MQFVKEMVKKVVFGLFPQVKGYRTFEGRISKLELAVSSVAASPLYSSDDDSLNRQDRRKEIVRDLMALQRPEVIVETGTHTGNTTGFFAKSGAKVFTSELEPIYMWCAQTRLRNFSNIDFFIGDSRTFLKKIADNAETITDKKTFFYLDAHWYDDLPLFEEIKIITEKWTPGKWIILIDDFCVPGDEGYGYPSYGPNNTLNYAYIKQIVEEKKLKVFYPSVPSSLETGYKTGYVFICNETGEAADYLQKVKNLK